MSSRALAAVNLKIDGKDVPKVKILFDSTSKNNMSAKSDVEEILGRVKNNLIGTDLFEIAHKPSIQKNTTPNIAAVSIQSEDLSIEKILLKILMSTTEDISPKVVFSRDHHCTIQKDANSML